MKNFFSIVKSLFISNEHKSNSNVIIGTKPNVADEILNDKGGFPILIKRSEYESTEKDDRIEGIIEYINYLQSGLYTDEELDRFIPMAQMVYFVDYYRCQVNNGGLDQYFENSKFNESQNKIVLDGLTAMGANKNRDLFQKGCKAIAEASSQIIGHYAGLDDSEEINFEELKQVTEKLNKLTDEFFNLNHNTYKYPDEGEEAIKVLTHKFIDKIDTLKILSDESYENELKNILSRVSNFDERLNQAEEKWNQNKPVYYKASESICRMYGLELLSVNALDFGEDTGKVTDKESGENHTLHYHITTDKGYHYVIDNGGELVLINGETHKSLGSMSKAEIK